ncbi:MAG: hypothetical protein NUW06_06455 [Candidatus Acetothermia bacterium]|jgi:hypothetical protein|nr:hypothetical protein [Candidatus Acetothermia bacterium]MDH7505724.1 hypothetical protein [Candidatus Acetothermia bacterium]
MNDGGFFAGLIGGLEEQCHSEHPPAAVLRKYVWRRLPEGRDLRAEVERLLSSRVGGRWTLSQVSLHVATCGACAREVARLRAGLGLTRESAFAGDRPTLLSRKMRRRLAYSIPVAVTLALILVLFFLPHPVATSYCRFGALAM